VCKPASTRPDILSIDQIQKLAGARLSKGAGPTLAQANVVRVLADQPGNRGSRLFTDPDEHQAITELLAAGTLGEWEDTLAPLRAADVTDMHDARNVSAPPDGTRASSLTSPTMNLWVYIRRITARWYERTSGPPARGLLRGAFSACSFLV